MPSNQTQTITIKLASEEEVKRPINADEVKRVISQANELDANAFEKWIFTYFNIPATESLSSYEVINELILSPDPPVAIRQWNVDTVPYTKEVLVNLAFNQLANNLASVVTGIAMLDEEHGTDFIDDSFLGNIDYPEDLDDEGRYEYGRQYIEDHPLEYIAACLDYMEGWGGSYEDAGDIGGTLDTVRLRLDELLEIAVEMGWYA
jgi:hypothetical protein